nr:hypothetical protein BHI3_15580 [Bacteriovorax sp. HI3]
MKILSRRKVISFLMTSFSALFATVIIIILQLYIYFGARYELYPKALADKFQVTWQEEGGYDPFNSSWDLQWYFELPLFIAFFFLIKFVINKITKRENLYKISHVFLLLSVYVVCLSQSSFGRDLFLAYLPERIEKSIEINCLESVITINQKKFSKNPSFCMYCPHNDKGCVFKGLKEPEFNKRIFRWLSKS